MNQIKATDFPEVYEDLGIDTGDLGCIMIDVEPIVVSDIIMDTDYYYSDEHQYVNGNVSEDVPHLTLLYGLMNSGPAMKKHVYRVLDGAEHAAWWPTELIIDKVDFFYGNESDYVTIIALIKVTDELEEGNKRLKLLPHIDTFDGYRPHVTLAYVKANAPWQDYVRALDTKLMGTSIKTVGINLGD